MSTLKIRLNTYQRCSNRDTKFKRGIAPREGFVEICPETKKISLKNGDYKCKPWDTTISRSVDQSYINSKKELYSGLCFETRQDAQNFMNKHKDELNTLANTNPLFDHWSIMTVIERFEPKNKVVYGRDVKEE